MVRYFALLLGRSSVEEALDYEAPGFKISGRPKLFTSTCGTMIYGALELELTGGKEVSDKKAAEIFALFFNRLATDPTEQNRRWALEMFAISREHDFHPVHMDCFDALRVLGVARLNEASGMWHYAPFEESEE